MADIRIFEVKESFGKKAEEAGVIRAPEQKIRLIDAAARGSIDAAADLAEGYLRGHFGEPVNKAKAKKWAGYAAKKGNLKAQKILEELS